MAAVHILVVEDDVLARDAMAELLRDEGYRVTTATDGVAAIAAIDDELPDLVISDVRMPGADGFDVVRRLRSRPTSEQTPILLVSAESEAHRRVVGLDLGADDFLTKPVDPGELLARVRSQLRRAEERGELARRAVSDPLTGVLNRRGIGAALQREEQRARRTGGSLSVLMVDVDHFKALNDALGHQVGDTVLRQVARSLTDAVRAVDHVGRFGGDEFLVVLPDADAAAAGALALRLRSLRLPALGIDGDRELEVTISIGTATLRADETIDTMVERSDREMYRVKRTGELPVVVPPP
jgi:two-component system, cell cycle response regulator